VLAGIAGHAAAQARPQPAQELTALINAYRSDHRFCAGRTVPAGAPLAPQAELAAVPLKRGADLQQVLKQAGYRAALAQAIVLSGPRDAAGAMRYLRENYCEAILDGRFTEIGVERDGANWRIVLAQPLIAADLGDWRAAGRQVLALVNAARAQPRLCGSERFPAVAPLTWDTRLAEAAAAHSRDMARRNYFSHTGRDGQRVGARAERAGYEWRAIGENIATGQGSAERAMAGWLASPTHCANLMDARYTHMGAAYAIDSGADTTIYWTQVFGAPR
jgi:uncharacterized protein YkwD